MEKKSQGWVRPLHYEKFIETIARWKEEMRDQQGSENNLEYDLVNTDWILEKVRSNASYAADIYAALCNNEFQKMEVMPILQDQNWSCTWRYAGEIVSIMLGQGNYLDWYCGGNEGLVTEEVEQDLKKLKWQVVPTENT
jgi:hypothetical protein